MGWTAAEVRSVIGESGTGWCELYEVRADDEEEQGELGSMFSFSGDEDELGSVMMMSESENGSEAEAESYDGAGAAMDPSDSFILPTLDFSSSFLAASSPFDTSPPSAGLSRSSESWISDINLFAYPHSSLPASPSSDSSTFSFHDSDSGSDSDSDLGSGSASWVQHGSSGLGFGFSFSSEFAARLGGAGGEYGEGPREVMF